MKILGATSPVRLPIGHSDYRRLRLDGLTYVDKTLWMADVIDNAAPVLLVPRPRRFGKTLNMSTMRYFLGRSVEDRAWMFEDTEVWSADDGRYRQHFQRYPVIYLTFKDLKKTTWEACAEQLARQLASAVRELMRSAPAERKPSSNDLRMAQMGLDTTPINAFTDMLLIASKWIWNATGERAVILIDEYDSPLHAAWQYGYWDEAVSFFRDFLSAGLKDNEALFKGVLTGILRVSKEGLFSGMNHVLTASTLNDTLASAFGFTESEVVALATLAGHEDRIGSLRTWYNGYRFGELHPQQIYNPWSILYFLTEPGNGPRPFWKNTSDNVLVRQMLVRHAAQAGPWFETLLRGESVRLLLDENVALQDLAERADEVIGLLLFSGYLTPSAIEPTEEGVWVSVRIPNLEVRSVFVDTFQAWLRQGLVVPEAPGKNDPLDAMAAAMLCGDATDFEEQLESRLINMLSYHDVSREPVEAVYQAFIVGMLVQMKNTHRVASNREAGFGRADVLIVPHQPGPGAVLELKRVSRRETPEEALQRAVKQLADRQYAREVRAAGATEVHQYAVVFDGKQCWVQTVAE